MRNDSQTAQCSLPQGIRHLHVETGALESWGRVPGCALTPGQAMQHALARPLLVYLIPQHRTAVIRAGVVCDGHPINSSIGTVPSTLMYLCRALVWEQRGRSASGVGWDGWQLTASSFMARTLRRADRSATASSSNLRSRSRYHRYLRKISVAVNPVFSLRPLTTPAGTSLLL